MASKKQSKQKSTDLKPCDLAEVPVPADYPFGSLLCRKEHEGNFKRLFPISPEAETLKEDKISCVKNA
jgi:hypothetical protein